MLDVGDIGLKKAANDKIYRTEATKNGGVQDMFYLMASGVRA